MEHRETLQDALTRERWETVGRQLLAKTLREFTYEDLLAPTRERTDGDWDRYLLSFGDVAYRFRATSRLFDSLHVEPESVERREGDREWAPATDPVQFLLDARDDLGVDDATASHFVREYTNTLVADAHIHARKARADPDESILDMDYAAIEGEMEGHPWFTVSKGRIGFGYDDYVRYAPEMKRPQSLLWVAARRDRATFSAVSDLDYETLIAEELGEAADAFRSRLADRGLDPASYYLMPVHQWQWTDTVAQLFAGDIARNDLVPLGEGPDTYLPQQSIRTLSNVDHPDRRHVKVPIRVLNTIVYRGLPGEQALAAPRVTEVVTAMRDGDPFLRDECDLVLPGEVASLNYDHPAFSQLPEAPYQYHELLGAVWRQSVTGLVAADEQPLTLSALMHEDLDGSPVVVTLADRAGLSLSAWLDELFDVLLGPLLHYLYRYGLVFMPHGTNTILLLADGRPSRLAIKDYVDEIAISERPLPEQDVVPDDLREHPDIVQRKPPEALCQHIVGTLFVCVLRYVSDLLAREAGYSEERFWRQVRDSVERYQAAHPELESRFDRFDLLAPEFAKVCLNRNRLREYGYDADSDPPQFQDTGTVANALHEVGD